MNIFYFSSDLFVSVMAVSIVSLLENNKNIKKIIFYIADDGITNEKKKKLNKIIQNYSSDIHIRKIIYIDTPGPDILLKYPFKSRYQIGHSYFRMCIGTLLPKSVNRVLCLDSDTLICGNLKELWDIDMKGNIIAGVSDCVNVVKYNKKFKIQEKDIYCNAGVFLVELNEWRNQKIEEKIIRRIHEQNGNVFFFEQTLMNWSCKGKILPLLPEYNVYTLFWAFEYKNLIKWRKPINFFTEKQIEEAKNNPKIVHFTRNFYMLSRPWIKGCNHPMTSEYLKYKRLTYWTELDNTGYSKKMKRKCAIWRMLPQSAVAWVANILYNEIRPRLWWKNE